MAQIQEQITSVLQNAIIKFNAAEQHLLANDLSERCICSKFACYLERELKKSVFRNYDVDVEYNRGYGGKDHCIKELYGKRIVLDLIVHKRSYDIWQGYDNLFCIEMKKDSNRRGLGDDEKRLRALTNNIYGYNYRAGFTLLAFKDRLEIGKSFFNPAYRDI